MAKTPKDRPVLSDSDAVLSAPLTIPGPGETHGLPGTRPQLHGAADAVIGAPLTPPPTGAHEEALQLGVDSAGGYTVPKELDGKKRHPR